MEVKYQEVTHRFREERKRLGMTQEELCRKLCMSQGHYCKTEQGKNRFTYNELQHLAKIGVDLHYVYTGERLVHLEYYTFLTNCGQNVTRCLAEMVFPLISYSLQELSQKAEDALCQRIKYEKCLLARDRQEDSYFYQLRRYKSYSQCYMAELLGIDIKKYTSLEKCKSFGDSELLLHVYNHFGISPLIMLNAENGIAREICALLEQLSEKESRRYFQYIKLAYENLLHHPVGAH